MYSRTYTNMGSGATSKADPATLSGFRLDKYETTVARFREYVKYLENGGSPPAAASGKHTHLNDGKGLADSGKSGSFEPGWDASWSSKIPSGAGATAKWKTALTGGGCASYGSFTGPIGKERSAAGHLHELVRVIRLLHLGRRLSAERSGVEVRRRWRR